MTETIWHEVWRSIQADFADLPGVAAITQLMMRLLLAALLGGLLGWQREQYGKAAGLRTHMLVALGSAFFVLIPAQAGMSLADLSRVLQGVIAGIGFLGAGTILKLQTQEQIQGLTTAAGLWFTAAIGIAAGLGREVSAILGTILAFIILALLPYLSTNIASRSMPRENTNDPSQSPKDPA